MTRIQSLDLARGFSVLFIPIIHAVMVFSDPSVHTTVFGYCLTFIAEGPGAQLFMTIMGIVFTFKEKYSTVRIVNRAAVLLLAGYLLNALKFVLPFLAFGLPEGINYDLQLQPGNELLQLFLLGDILHFAAIAIIILHVVYRMRNYWFWSIVITTITIMGSPLLWDISDNYLISLFTGQPPRIFFPVLSWIIYPLIGLTLGYLFKQNIDRLFYRIGSMGMAFLCIGGVVTIHTGNISSNGFYRTYPGETLIHIGIVLLSLTFWNFIERKCTHNYFLQALKYGSRHITSIYILQWIFICWWIPVIGYQTLGLWQSMLAAVLMTSAVYILNESYLQIKRRYELQ